MRFWVSTVFAALVASVVVGSAAAGPPIDWDPLFTWEPGATPTSSMPDSELQGVGIVSKFDSPFQDLDATNPAVEYTIYIHGLISQGTVPQGPPANTFYVTHYTGGFIEIYCDSTPEASFDVDPPNAGVPGDFTDGTLILSGTFNSFYTQTNNFTTFKTGNMEGDITWTGGTLIGRTHGGDGRPCPGLFTGGVTWYPGLVPHGYIFRHDGKIDLNCPTATRTATWGSIKGTYR